MDKIIEMLQNLIDAYSAMNRRIEKLEITIQELQMQKMIRDDDV